MLTPRLKPGKYRHYKTRQTYQLLSIARHSETHEEMAIYQALYTCDKFGSHQIWARPLQMFMETIQLDDKVVPRFEYLGNE